MKLPSLVAVPLLAALTPSAAAAQTSPSDHFEESLCEAGLYERFDLMVDLNGDAFPDAIGYWRTNQGPLDFRVRGYLGDGQGGFHEAWVLPLEMWGANYCGASSSAAYCTDICAASFNGDSRTDFAIMGGGKTLLFTTSPTDPFALPAPYASFAFGGHSVESGDLDANGLDDIVFHGGNSFALNHGPGQFQFVDTGVDLASGMEPLIGDYNGDGRPDIVNGDYLLSSATDIHLKIIPIAGGVTFPELELVAHNDLYRSFVQLRLAGGDIDGDGDEDIVLFDEANEEYIVFRRTGPAQYDVEPWTPGGPASDLVDLDGDGDLDGACCGGGTGGHTFPNTEATMFRVTFNDGTGRFGPAITVPSIGGRELAGAVDIDMDGDIDLVGGRCVLLNLVEAGHAYCDGPGGGSGGGSVGGAATLGTAGSASIARNDLSFLAEALPANSFAHGFFGTEAQSTPLGGGLLCAGGDWIYRLPVVQANAQGSAQFALDHLALPQTGLGSCQAGTTRYFQLWFRDPVVGSNLTNGYRVTFAP